MGEFFHMDGYGGYIWPAYATLTILMGGLWLLSRRSLKRSEQALAGLERQRPRRPSRDEGARDEASP